MDEFHYVSLSNEVIFGAGSLGRLAEAVDRLGYRRLMLCASHSMELSGHLAEVEALLGSRLALSFAGVKPHVQDVQVDDAVALALEKQVDGVIGLGGGSPIGMAKAVAFTLSKEKSIPVFAIPTTYAGSEMTALYGVTHSRETPPRKVTVSDPIVAPRLVIYDPQLTLDLSPEMTAATGMNALAHCIEALYSVTHNPLSSACAVSAVHSINSALLSCYKNGNDLEARTQMLIGAHLAGLSLTGVKLGLHHGLCHILGGTANVPHGVANSIILPHAIRFNADATAAQLLPAAQAMGVTSTTRKPAAVIDALAQKIADLTAEMNLPQRLREAGVPEADLPRLARLGFESQTVQNNPKHIKDAAQIEKLLREAW